MPKDPKLQAIKVAMEQIEKEYGKGSIMKLGDKQHLDIAVIPTGSITLDIALGIGGLPRGRISEIYGPEASGKTTLCLHLIAEAQKAGGVEIDLRHDEKPLSKDQAYVAETFIVQKDDPRFAGMKDYNGFDVQIEGDWGVDIKIE